MILNKKSAFKRNFASQLSYKFGWTMEKLNKLNDLLDNLYQKETYIKSELLKHKQMAKFASVQIHIFTQKLHQNLNCINTIKDKIEKTKKYNTI